MFPRLAFQCSQMNVPTNTSTIEYQLGIEHNMVLNHAQLVTLLDLFPHPIIYCASHAVIFDSIDPNLVEFYSATYYCFPFHFFPDCKYLHRQ
jgi:hypothetical protein